MAVQLTVVSDYTEQCPYLPTETSRLPLRLPREGLSQTQMDLVFQEGYRRTGFYYYRTECPACRACEPIRVDVREFTPSRTQSRTKKRGDQVLETRVDRASCDEQRLNLFNEHRINRNLDRERGRIDEASFCSFLVDSSCATAELSFWLDGELVAVSIADVGQRSVSAVYCYFSMKYNSLSLGTYAILKQIELAAANDKDWLYLGLYVSKNDHLNYKSRFVPHERLIDGNWHRFEERH